MNAFPGLLAVLTMAGSDVATAGSPDSGHTVHDDALHSFLQLNRLEVWDSNPGTGVEWEGQAWIGKDRNRLWVRSEGSREDGATVAADIEALYGRRVARWWEWVAGLRQSFDPGSPQTFAAMGVMGRTPYWFDIEATAYLGEGGQTAVRVELESDLLLTNRLILQPLIEANFHGEDDPGRGIGSGLSTLEMGLRLRYEFTRQLAPYVGIVRDEAVGDTEDFRRNQGQEGGDTRLVAGLRVWF